MPWTRLRTIVEEAAAQEAADSFSEQFPRFEDAWEGLKWLLARSPEVGLGQIDDNGEATGYWLHGQASDELAQTPEIWVVYTFTANEVVIFGLRATEPPEPEAL